MSVGNNASRLEALVSVLNAIKKILPKRKKVFNTFYAFIWHTFANAQLGSFKLVNPYF